MAYRTYLLIMISIAACIGALMYICQHSRIIIMPRPAYDDTEQTRTYAHETITIWCASDHAWYSEERTIISLQDDEERASRIIQQWIAVMEDHQLVPQPCRVQAVLAAPTHHMLYVSFDQTPFDAHQCAYRKLCTIESMLASLRENGITYEQIYMLVNHQPLQDPHIDGSFAWPLTGFICHEEHQQAVHTCPHNEPETIVLIPSGDGSTAGRAIGNQFERGITLAICGYLSDKLTHHGYRVHISRAAGEQTQPLHSAAYANRLRADICLSVHAYHEPIRPVSYIYYLLYHPDTDFWTHMRSRMQFTPHDQAHITWIHHTWHLAHTLAARMHHYVSHHMHVCSPTGMPFYPLIGIDAPAVGIEIGVRESDEWHAYAEALYQSVREALQIYGSHT